MSAADLSAGLFAAWVVALLAAGIWLITRLVSAEIDRATRLPDPRRPRDDEPPTVRIDPDLIPLDLPRKRVDTWL